MQDRCEYCNGDKCIPLDTDVGQTWINGNLIENAYGEAKINYCPMCGKNLTT